MRIAMLTPAPTYVGEWNWAFDVEAEALRAAGAEVVAVPWTELTSSDGYDLVLPLVTWGYHLRLPEWLAFLDQAENEGWPMVNPPKLLRWNSDKAYLAELGAKGIASVPTLEVDHLNEAALTAAHGVLGAEEDQAASLRRCLGHIPPQGRRASANGSARQAHAGSALARLRSRGRRI
jgi:glutathione synthase/RimK-type ligase-like ATP-grasp enzyme